MTKFNGTCIVCTTGDEDAGLCPANGAEVPKLIQPLAVETLGAPLIFCGLYQIVAVQVAVLKAHLKFCIVILWLVVKLKETPPAVFPPPDNGGTLSNVI